MTSQRRLPLPILPDFLNAETTHQCVNLGDYGGPRSRSMITSVPPQGWPILGSAAFQNQQQVLQCISHWQDAFIRGSAQSWLLHESRQRQASPPSAQGQVAHLPLPFAVHTALGDQEKLVNLGSLSRPTCGLRGRSSSR
jgi:hypothetical protein